MQKSNYYNQCPYMAHYFGFNCPAMQNPIGAFRPQRDIERVIQIINQKLANEISEIVKLGVDKELLNYFIREMVDYLDKNYDRYTYSLSGNVTTASDEIKVNLYWIFNILRIFGVPFELYIDLLDNVVVISLESLRTT